MKKANKKRARPEMLNHYDFSGGVRGKYYAKYAQGTNIVLLDPDVAKAFPTSAAVNNALRNLTKSRKASPAADPARRRHAR
jgi:hypothetical protein